MRNFLILFFERLIFDVILRSLARFHDLSHLFRPTPLLSLFPLCSLPDLARHFAQNRIYLHHRFDFQKKLTPSTNDGRPASATDPRKVATITGTSQPRGSSAMRSNANAAAIAESNSRALPEQDKLSKHIDNLKKLPEVVAYLTEEKKLDRTLAHFILESTHPRLAADSLPSSPNFDHT